MGQSRKRKTLLASQKPKKRWHIPFPSSKKIILGTLGLAATGFLVYRGYSYLGNTALFAFEERPKLHAIGGLSESEQTAILQKYREMSKVDPDELERFSRTLFRGMGLRSIQLIQTAPDRIAIATENFTPRLIADLDKPRFVTADGIVFGTVGSDVTPGLPTLHGLYKNAPFTKSENETLVLSAANQKIVDEALLAIQEAARYNIQYSSLTYNEFRGLSAQMLELDYRITLGDPPFKAKYQNLEKVITSLKDRGTQRASIEVDFKGKAFVKEF